MRRGGWGSNISGLEMQFNFEYPMVFFHVDVDSDQTLGRFYGGGRVTTNLVYERGIPRMLEIFNKFRIKATFFINGVDLEKPDNLKLVKQIFKDGHELASHSYYHRFGFRSWGEKDIRRDLELNLRMLKQLTGKNNFGFRAPGYDIDSKTIRLVTDTGHLYDSSLFPSILNLALKWYLRRKGVKVSPGYGELKNIWRPDFPHKWFSKDNSFIWEMPVAVFPVIRLPLSSLFVASLPESYFSLGLKLFKKRKQPLVFLFHAIEFVDTDPARELTGMGEHPSFKLSWKERKRKLINCLTLILRDFHCQRTDVYVRRNLL